MDLGQVGITRHVTQVVHALGGSGTMLVRKSASVAIPLEGQGIRSIVLESLTNSVDTSIEGCGGESWSTIANLVQSTFSGVSR